MSGRVGSVVELLEGLPTVAPGLLASHGISAAEYPEMLRAAAEQMRGKASASQRDKRRFLEAILEHGRSQGVFLEWAFTGGGGRNDYRVVLPDGRKVAIESKGGPDGNNTTIWDRPGWADFFVIWHQSPMSLVNQPGRNMWSGIATRLLPHIASTGKVVDAVVFFDGRCGSESRRCPKEYGIEGAGLRAAATEIPGQDGRDWLPPPCIYLMPRTIPRPGTNPDPESHSPDTMPFVGALLTLFNVPPNQREQYIHYAEVHMRNASSGALIKPVVRSHAWPDHEERVVETGFKPLKRE